MCGKIGSSVDHVMLAGVENSGKTYWLYSRLKKLITSSTNIKTIPTYGKLPKNNMILIRKIISKTIII